MFVIRPMQRQDPGFGYIGLWYSATGMHAGAAGLDNNRRSPILIGNRARKTQISLRMSPEQRYLHRYCSS